VQNLTWAQWKSIGRHGISFAAGGVGALATAGAITQQDSTHIAAALDHITNGLGELADGLAVLAGILGPVYAAYMASHSASPQEQIKTVAAMPDVKAIVTTPAVAEATPSAKVIANAA
jgi:hypothetical protein